MNSQLCRTSLSLDVSRILHRGGRITQISLLSTLSVSRRLADALTRIILATGIRGEVGIALRSSRISSLGHTGTFGRRTLFGGICSRDGVPRTVSRRRYDHSVIRTRSTCHNSVKLAVVAHYRVAHVTFASAPSFPNEISRGAGERKRGYRLVRVVVCTRASRYLVCVYAAGGRVCVGATMRGEGEKMSRRELQATDKK